MRTPPEPTTSDPTHSKRPRPWTLAELRAQPTITVEVAGAALGIERSSAYTAVRRGEIPSLRVGRRLVVPTVPLLRMLGADGPPLPLSGDAQTAG